MPYSSNTEMTTDAMIRLAWPFLLLLVTFQIPSPAYLVLVMQRLDPDFHGHNFVGRDLFQTIENQRYLFWLNTGELPESMLDIAVKISGNLNRITTRGSVRRKIGRYKLSNLNKVLLTFIWIRKYPCIDTLALLFDVSSSNVSNIIITLSQPYGDISIIKSLGLPLKNGTLYVGIGYLFLTPSAVLTERLMKYIVYRLNRNVSFKWT